MEVLIFLAGLVTGAIITIAVALYWPDRRPPPNNLRSVIQRHVVFGDKVPTCWLSDASTRTSGWHSR